MGRWGWKVEHNEKLLHEALTVSQVRQLLSKFDDSTLVLVPWGGCGCCGFDESFVGEVTDHKVGDATYALINEVTND